MKNPFNIGIFLAVLLSNSAFAVNKDFPPDFAAAVRDAVTVELPPCLSLETSPKDVECKAGPGARYEITSPAQPKINGLPVLILSRPLPPPQSQETVITQAIVVPGKGFAVLQIKAFVPGKGEIELLEAPELSKAAEIYNDATADRDRTTNFGAGVFAPYGGTASGPLSADGKYMRVKVLKQNLLTPVNVGDPGETPFAIHGFLHKMPVKVIAKKATACGASIDGVLEAGAFGVGWPSKTQMQFHVAIAGSNFQIRAEAKNVGREDTQLSMGWHPYFKIPDGQRQSACLSIPGAVRHEEVTNYDTYEVTHLNQPIVPGSKLDFNSPSCRPLATNAYDDCLMGPAEGYLKPPTATLTYPGVKLQVQGMEGCHRCMQVYSPADKNFVAIEHQCNHNDALSESWAKEDQVPLVKPGKSQKWGVNIDVSAQ